MPTNRNISIIIATYTEAKPFVEKIDWQHCVKRPFPVYFGKALTLVISGIGKTNAAMACAWLSSTASAECIVNIGAAGANRDGLPLGSIHHISKAVETDRLHLKTGRPFLHRPDVMDGFSTARLATSDRPVTKAEERRQIAALAELSDMEGAAVIQAARKFQTRCFLFKFVSDTPEHTIGQEIITNIRIYRDALFDFLMPLVLSKLKQDSPQGIEP
ncbi:MAG: hypothetical protein K9K82_04140 [Desulfobacteraceae bacterium]|nr:hypothetical protein [Desulfobacteraceae bacterium]